MKGRCIIFKVKEFRKLLDAPTYGKVVIPMSLLYSRQNKASMVMWKFIQPALEDENTEAGKIQLSLTYQPSESIVVLGILAAEDLRNNSVSGFVDPFVKVIVKLNGISRFFECTTDPVHHSLHPMWQEHHEMLVNPSELHRLAVDVQVRDNSVTARGMGNFLGRVRLGHGTRGQGARHWGRMLQNPQTEVVLWHTLVFDILG